MKFYKMHGCGNDYIFIDCMDNAIDGMPELSKRLSDRHFGIGGDGVIFVYPSDIADARMRMYNADGSEGRMCGNGLRCLGKFLCDVKGVCKERMTVETLSGVVSMELISADAQVTGAIVEMGRPVFTPKRIPINLPEPAINHAIHIGGKDYRITALSMGNPHCVIFVDDVSRINLVHIGPLFEFNSSVFPMGVNVEFAHVISKTEIEMRVWERGSGETLACGSGACATVAAAVANGLCDLDTDVTVKLRGGDLIIRMRKDGMSMAGDAVMVFSGDIDS